MENQVLSIVANIRYYLGAKLQYVAEAIITDADGNVSIKQQPLKAVVNEKEMRNQFRQFLKDDFERLRRDDDRSRARVFVFYESVDRLLIIKDRDGSVHSKRLDLEEDR